MSKPVMMALCCLALLASPGRGRAEDVASVKDAGANAALKYWQAFAQLPTVSMEQEKLLKDWRTAPVDDAARRLIRESEAALRYLHRGASLQNCDWALDYDDGPGLLLPQLQKARTLAQLAALRARDRAERGEQAGALQDALDILVLARHVGKEPIFIIVLVGYAIEGIGYDALASFLPSLKPSDLKLIQDRLDHLPAAASLSQVLMTERKYMGGWLLQRIQAAEQTRAGSWTEIVKAVFPAGPEFGIETKEIQQILNIGSAEKATSLLRALLSEYDELKRLWEQGKAQFDQQYPSFRDRTRAANPFAKLLLPAMDKVSDAHARAMTRTALFKAALAVAQEGPEKLKTIRDPYATGTFEYQAQPPGFELRSHFKYQGQPVTLTVGPARKS